MKEADVQLWVKQYLQKAFPDTLYIFKVPQGQYTSRRGIPDLVASIEGKFVAIEVKMGNGRLTKLQEYEIAKIDKAGGLAFTCYGKDEALMKTVCDHIRG